MSQASSDSLRAEAARVEDRLRAQARQLAEDLLTGLEVVELERAHAWTGLEFLRSSVRVHLDRERTQLEYRREELLRHPDFARSCADFDRNLEEEKQRLLRHKNELAPFLTICHGHPRFSQLLRNGYGTPRYATPFWRMSFYADRRAAQELCQRAGKSSFAELLQEYLAATESIGILRERLEHLEKAPPLTPRREYKQLEQRLQLLEQTHLTTARSRLMLALLKGSLWEPLSRADLPAELKASLDQAGLLYDQLQELREQS